MLRLAHNQYLIGTETMPAEVHSPDPRITWSLVIDDDWEREYKLTSLVRGVRKVDGLYNASRAVGLPTVGSVWAFGGDLDIWAFCRPSKLVNSHQPRQGEIDVYFTVEQTFSTKPIRRCQDDEVSDPLLKPPKLSATTVKEKEEAMYDRFGIPILNSAHEQIRGPYNEWDVSHTQVVIEQNVLILDRELIEPMRDTVNDLPMWGYPSRSIKLSDFNWTEAYYGTCFRYYIRRMVFDIRVQRLNLLNPFPIPGVPPVPGPIGTLLIPAWDRDLLDEGTKCLNGEHSKIVGTNCELLITTEPEDGSITNAVINVAGSGYPPSKIVPLFVVNPIPGTTSNGVVLVVTGSDGIPTAVSRVQLPGSGYEDGLKNTVQRGNWVLSMIGGANGHVPHYNNPQDFMRFVDPKGNQARCILDGRGMPIALDETPGGIHVEKYGESNFLLLNLPDLPEG